MASYIEHHYPDQFKALGGGNRRTQYKRHLSACVDVASMVNGLLYATSRIFIESETKQKTRVYTPDKVDRQDRKQKHLNNLNSNLVWSVLLGRKRCRVLHKQVEVEWFIQKINYFVDVTTGEIDDQLAIAYRDDVRTAGYPCELYYIDFGVLGCLVITDTLPYIEAQKIAKKFAGKYKQLRADFNSLESPVPLPLSVNKDGDLCHFHQSPPDEIVLDQLTSTLPVTVEQEDEQESAVAGPSSPTEIVTDWVVEKSFRDSLLSVTGEDPVLLRLVGVALFSAFRDDEFAVLNTMTMEQILGKSLGKTSTITYHLKRLNKLVPIQTVQYSRAFKRATAFKITEPEPYMNEMAKTINYPKSRPVWLSSGKEANTISPVIPERDTAYKNDVSTKLISYLNNLPANTFTTRINCHLGEMMKAADSLDEEIKDKVLGHLSYIQIHPKPHYRQGQFSSRIYAVNGHYQHLKREIREIAFSDCIKLDLAYSQLAISSKLFQCSEMIDLCKKGNVWSFFTNCTGLDKKTIKQYLYFLLFKDEYTHNPKELIATEKRLLSTHEFRAYYDSRTIFLQKTLNTTNTDCFNNTLLGDKNNKLSALLQSYELYLLSPALQYFFNIKDNRTRLVLFLHDGFYLSGSKRERLNVARKMVNLVNKTANNLNIPTSLTIETN